MKIIILNFIAIIVTTPSIGQSKLDNIYVATEKICWEQTDKDNCVNLDSSNPKWKWYHLNVLKIKGDSVFLDQSPIRVYKKDTLFSSSDGGFYYYSGKLTTLTDSTFHIKLTELFCDYCGEFSEILQDRTYKRIYRTTTYFCKLNKDGFWANDVFYKITNSNENLISENPQSYRR